MNKTSGPVCLLLCAILLSSCAEDTLIGYGDIPAQVWIQGRLSPDTTFSVHVGTILGVTDPADFEIPADVSVDIVDVTDPLAGIRVPFYLENGVFVSPQKRPEIGHAYKIFVNAPGYPIAEATTSIPAPVPLSLVNSRIKDLKVIQSEASPDKKNVSYRLHLEFEQPTNHRYFHFCFFQTTTINHGSVSNPDMRAYVYDMNPQFPDENGYYQHHETGVLVDAFATDSRQYLEFEFVDYTLAEIEVLGELFIEVRTVSEEYYNYFTSLSRQLISIEDPFAEPITVYNNIDKGKGNFSGFSRIVYSMAVIP